MHIWSLKGKLGCCPKREELDCLVLAACLEDLLRTPVNALLLLLVVVVVVAVLFETVLKPPACQRSAGSCLIRKGQMGSALVGSLQFHFLTEDFLSTPVNLLLYYQK